MLPPSLTKYSKTIGADCGFETATITHHKFCPAFLMLETLAVPESEMSAGRKYSVSELANLSSVRKVNLSAGKNWKSAANTKNAKSFFMNDTLYFFWKFFLEANFSKFYDFEFLLSIMRKFAICCIFHQVHSQHYRLHSNRFGKNGES